MPSLCQCSQDGLIIQPARVNGIRLGNIGFFSDAAMDAAMANPAGADENFAKSFFKGGTTGAARGAADNPADNPTSGGGMWGAILGMVTGGGKGARPNLFANELALVSNQNAQEASRRRNMALLALGVGVVGFAGLVYLVGRK